MLRNRILRKVKRLPQGSCFAVMEDDMCTFKAKLATMFGVNAAVICQYLWDMQKADVEKKDVIYDAGKHWVRCSQNMLTDAFPFLTKSRVQTALNLLIKAGVMKKACLNSCKFDHTTWYSFTDLGTYIMKEKER